MTSDSHDGSSLDSCNRFRTDCVLVIDRQWICRSGLKYLILQKTNYKHVVEAEDLTAVGKKLSRWSNVKFIIADIDFPDQTALDAFDTLQSIVGQIPILVTSTNCCREDLLTIINRGAAGYVSKDAGEEEFLHAFNALEQGEIRISRALFDMQSKDDKSDQTRNEAKSKAVASLTRRQQQVLRQLAQGRSNREIADNLKVSEHTIKIHVAAILKSLGVANRTQAALLARA